MISEVVKSLSTKTSIKMIQLTIPILKYAVCVYIEEKGETSARESSQDTGAGRSLCKERGLG